MIPKWAQNGGGGKWLFHHGAPPGTTSRPRGTLGPPKAHFWSQNGVPRAPWDPKSLPKWPPRDPWDPKIPKKDPQNTKKQLQKTIKTKIHKCIQIVFVQEREKHLQQTKKRNSWNSPNNQDKQNTKKANKDNLTKTNQDNAHNPNGPNKSKKQYKQTGLPMHRTTSSNNQNKPTQSKN